MCGLVYPSSFNHCPVTVVLLGRAFCDDWQRHELGVADRKLVAWLPPFNDVCENRLLIEALAISIQDVGHELGQTAIESGEQGLRASPDGTVAAVNTTLYPHAPSSKPISAYFVAISTDFVTCQALGF